LKLKKSLLALAVFGAFAGAASAPIFRHGLWHCGRQYRAYGHSSGKLTSMGTGSQSPSRIGFKGMEDLGNGLKATFNLEQGFD